MWRGEKSRQRHQGNNRNQWRETEAKRGREGNKDKVIDNMKERKKGKEKKQRRRSQVWAQQSSLLAVSGAQHAGEDSICLDLCLNLTADCFASPCAALPPFLSPTRPASLFAAQGHSLRPVRPLGSYRPSAAARFGSGLAEAFPQIRGGGAGLP